MPTFEILCLANSKKHGGRCVAGLRTDGGGWVRPVADSEDGALFPEHYTLPDGSEPRILDVLRISPRECRPKPHQPENWCMTRAHWDLVSRPAPGAAVSLLQSSLERGPALFGSLADRVPFDSILRSPAPASLALVAPQDLKWWIACNPATGKSQARARFRLDGALYNLVLTDPICLARLMSLPPGIYPATSAGFKPDERFLLTVSLGEPFEGNCFKLAAGVVALPAAVYSQVVAARRDPASPPAAVRTMRVRPEIRDPLLAEYEARRGSALARRILEAFDAEWPRDGSEDRAVQRMRQEIESHFRERLNEADSY